MKRSLNRLLLLGIAVAPACTNPTIDPNATLTAAGSVVDETGAPLASAEVRLVKYWSTLNALRPSVETLFSEDPSGDSVLGVDLVSSVQTNGEGEFEFVFKGRDIQKPGGFTDDLGNVEVADAVLVVRDPLDESKLSGVFTYNYVYQKAALDWFPGELGLWDSQAEADNSDALTSGLIKLSWSKLERTSSTEVKNAYRVFVQPATGSGPRLIIYCNQDEQVEGGCAQDSADPDKVARYLSAYTVRYYYADADGDYAAFVQGNSPRYRFVSRFSIIEPLPDLNDNRDPIEGYEAFAVNTMTRESQDLTISAATDGNAETRETIDINGADAIYVKLLGNGASPLVSDAGILNSLVENVANGCLTLEFTVSAANDLTSALDVGMWEQKGKFCGENGARDEISALAVLDTSAQQGVTAAWMRVTADLGLTFEEVGEIAVFRKTN